MSAAALRAQIRSALPRWDLPLTFTPRVQPEVLPTGIAELDALTGGGIPKRCMTEIAGEPSTGRTTVLISLLARATRASEYCALIDTHDTFDPATAVESSADLDRLLWIRCGGNVEHALNATDRIAHAGGFGLIVFDMADADLISARRISLASWFRLRHAVEKTPAALLVAGRQFHARSCSQLQLEMRRPGAEWSGRLLRGLLFEAETRKHQMARSARFEARRVLSLA